MKQWINGPRITRENNYGILRILCAAAILYGHMYILVGNTAPVLFAEELNSIGFKLLMVLSGYLTTQSCIYGDKGYVYALKRIFRIVPGLLFYVVLAIIMGALFTTLTLRDYFLHPTTWAYFKTLFLNIQMALPGVFCDNPYPYSVNGSLWALPVEVFFYIIIFIVLKLFSRCKYRKVIITLIAFGFCALQIMHILFFGDASFKFYGTEWTRVLILAPYFFMGALYALTDIKKKCNLQRAFILLLLMISFKSNNYALYEMMNMLCLPYIFISIGECRPPLYAGFLNNCDISYGIYLWGFFVQQLLVNIIIVRGGAAIGPNIMFLLAMPLSAVMGAVSWYFVEKPAQNLLKRMLN